MSTDNTDTTSSDTSTSSKKISDPDEFSQTRRLRAIHDARDRVIDTRDRVEEARVLEKLDPRAGRQLFRRAVENYVLEVEELLTDDEVTTEVDYWNGIELGSMVIEPPASFHQLLDDDHTYLVPGSQIPQGREITFYGVKSVLDAGRPETYTFSIEVERKHHGAETVTETVGKEVPLRVSENAYRALNRFLHDVDVSLGMEEGIREYGFEEVNN